MSATRRQRGGRRGHGGGHAADDERWLLTYADMITLLMALFMVLFSIASVNETKLQVLSKSLEEAFSGKIFPGGTSIRETGASEKTERPASEPPIPAIQPVVDDATGSEEEQSKQSAEQEQEDFRRLKQQIDDYAAKHGLANQVQTEIAQRGLVIRLLTDKVLFDSGHAELKPQATPVLTEVSGLLQSENRHRIQVEGHTDNVPIRGSQFPTNWELSTARASRVVRFLIDHGVPNGRLGAAGFADLHPISDNTTAGGRARNRRVEIVLVRSGQEDATQGGDAP